MLLVVLGAACLVGSFLPLINPGFVEVSLKMDPVISSSNVAMFILSVPIFWSGMACSRKARSFKSENFAAKNFSKATNQKRE